MMDNPYLKWIERGLEKVGKSRSGLARALDLHPSQITKMMVGQRAIKASEIPVIARYLEERPPEQPGIAFAESASGESVPIRGEAAADIWFRGSFETARSARPGQYPNIPRVQDPRSDDLDQFAVHVAGESANAIIADGAFAVCVPYWEARPTPVSGDLVLIERVRGDLAEISVRRLRWIPSSSEWRLYQESANPDFQEVIPLGKILSQEPIMFGDYRLRIIGLVIWKAQPV